MRKGKPSTAKVAKGCFVPKYEYFAKAQLAAYCREDGVPFYVGKNSDERQFLKLATIQD